MKINENLILNSGKEYATKEYLIASFKLIEDLVAEIPYTLSFEGEINPENHMAIMTYWGNVVIQIRSKLEKKGSRKYCTFTIQDSEAFRSGTKNNLCLYNFPRSEAKFASVKNVKLEKGTEATIYIPTKADLADSALYPNKAGGGIWEEIRPI